MEDNIRIALKYTIKYIRLVMSRINDGLLHGMTKNIRISQKAGKRQYLLSTRLKDDTFM